MSTVEPWGIPSLIEALETMELDTLYEGSWWYRVDGMEAREKIVRWLRNVSGAPLPERVNPDALCKWCNGPCRGEWTCKKPSEDVWVAVRASLKEASDEGCLHAPRIEMMIARPELFEKNIDVFVATQENCPTNHTWWQGITQNDYGEVEGCPVRHRTPFCPDCGTSLDSSAPSRKDECPTNHEMVPGKPWKDIRIDNDVPQAFQFSDGTIGRFNTREMRNCPDCGVSLEGVSP